MGLSQMAAGGAFADGPAGWQMICQRRTVDELAWRIYSGNLGFLGTVLPWRSALGAGGKILQDTIWYDNTLWFITAESLPNLLFKSAGLCPRLAQTRSRPCADTSKPQDLCDAERASHLLPKTLDVDEAVLETSQGLVRGCAQNLGPGFSIFLLASFNPQGRRGQQSSELTEQTLAPLVLPSRNQIWSDHVRSSYLMIPSFNC